jgi:hypothetical protein
VSSLSDAAQWLVDNVGVDGVFTKEHLRLAFPGVAQIDRRVRDLRTRGWVIHTRREDPRLLQSEMRLVAIGGLDSPDSQVSARARKEALISCAYTCMLCGADGSGVYADARHERVVLTVRRVEGLSRPVAVCGRCRNALSVLAMQSDSLPPLASSAAELSDEEWAAACRARLMRRLRKHLKD